MTTFRKLTLLCVIAALAAAGTFSTVARADEMRMRDGTVTEGNRGRRGHGGRRHHGGGSGWAWAGLGAAVGLGILDAVTRDDSPEYVYVQPAPTYQVVQPATPYYYQPAPTTTYVHPPYVQPRYVQPNYGQTYVAPPPPPCNVCP